MDSNSSRLHTHTLRSLRQESQNMFLLMERRLGGKLRKSLGPNPNVIIPSLVLPLPEDIDNAFDGFKISHESLIRLDHQYRYRLQQTQEIHRLKFEEACRDICQVPRSTSSSSLPQLLESLRQVYESSYKKYHLPWFKEQIISFRSKILTSCESRKPPFNAEYTPILEKYFEKNAYPSAPDRQVLADKTTMTPRQIEVWFQNHRKRAKQNGKVVHRMHPNDPLPPSLERIASVEATSAAGKARHSPVALESDRSSEVNAITSPMQPGRMTSPIFLPPFSRVAKPNLNADNIFRFPAPEWPRKSSSRNINTNRSPVINIDDFISAFSSKLHLRDGSSKSKRKPLIDNISSNPWFFATTTIPSRAPHIALVRAPIPYNEQTLHNKPPLEPLTSTPGQPSGKLRKLIRKAAPFPKRHPSKYHPYCHSSTSTFHRRTRLDLARSDTSHGYNAISVENLPSRVNNATPSATQITTSWVATLELTQTRDNRATSICPPLDFASTSVYNESEVSSSPETESRVVSIESMPSFGSRTASISSLESSPPSSPTLQPQLDDPYFLDPTYFHFIDEIDNFTEMAPTYSDFSFGDDLLHKQDVASLLSACNQSSFPSHVFDPIHKV